MANESEILEEFEFYFGQSDFWKTLSNRAVMNIQKVKDGAQVEAPLPETTK